MHRLICAIILWCACSEIASGQVFAGDSLRVRNSREAPWNYGHLIRQDVSEFTLRSGTDTLRLAIAELQRVDRWKRNSPSLIMVTASIGALAAALGYNVATPKQERMPGAYWNWWIGGAAGGAVMGLIGYNIWPGQWRVVFNR